MKIAFLTPEYPNRNTGSSGGIGTSIKNLAMGLMQHGCEVRILVYGQKKDAAFEDNGIMVQQIKNIKFKGLSWLLTRKKIQKIINQLYSGGQIDLVEAPDWTGITSFIKTDCPIIVRLHGSDTYFCHLDQRPVKWINRFHEKKSIQKASALISVSRFTADTTNAVFGLNKKFKIIPNGIDVNLFNDNPILSKVNENNILYFGSLIRKKGLMELPLIFNKVAEKMPDANLILIGRDAPDIATGNSSTWKIMQPLFSEKAIRNVTFMGVVDYDEIKAHVSTAAICVFPSFAEALPVSWLEAMAMRKPLVASSIGWAEEVIDQNLDGMLAHPQDHTKFAANIIELLQNKELQNRLGNGAREKVLQKFSTEVVVKQNLEFYKNVIIDLK